MSAQAARKSPRRWVLVVLVVLAVLALGALMVVARGPVWIAAAMAPEGDFDPAKVPSAPDFSRDEAWLALPSRVDEADVALPELPAAAAPEADVFYLHPTSSVAPQWNAPWDDAAVRQASIRGGTLIQASAFNGSGAIYAPSYRQASGSAFTTPSASGAAAIDLAYTDVLAAFDEFLRRSGPTRPFLILAHSQGAALGARLLRERIAAGPLRLRLVAAWLVGVPLTSADLGGLPACAAPEQTGCVVTFNARGPEYRPGTFEFARKDSSVEPLCVNPLLGRTGDELAPRERHRGAVFFDTAAPALLPSFTGAGCRDGRLWLTDPRELPWRGLPSALLLRVMGRGNFHSVELQVFYADLRHDAARRLAAHQALEAGRTAHPG